MKPLIITGKELLELGFTSSPAIAVMMKTAEQHFGNRARDCFQSTDEFVNFSGRFYQ